MDICNSGCSGHITSGVNFIRNIFKISKNVSAAVPFHIWNLSAKSMTDTPSRGLIKQRINVSKDGNLFPLLISLSTRSNNVIRGLKHANPV